MTREEAVRDIKECLEENKWGCGKYTEAFCWAIYALNEECVIEDIKAEINNIDSMTFIGNGSGCASEMRTECLKIIDKHISGKETK